MRMTKATVATALVFLSALLFAGPQREDLTEPEYAAIIGAQWNAQVEVALWDSTRVDLETERSAYEIDWCENWAQGVGQCLYYAQQTNKKPGLILLRKNSKENRFVYRAKLLGERHGFDVLVFDTKKREFAR